MVSPEAVYNTWFGNPLTPAMAKQWFGKDPEFDRQIRDEFGSVLDAYPTAEVQDWAGTFKGLLSLVVLLDQFPRNAFRGTPRMFAFDKDALKYARLGVAQGMNDTLAPEEAMFILLPFEHSENISDQRESVRLFERWAQRLPAEKSTMGKQTLSYAVRHLRIVEHFGRFPHRNAILGRPSTQEEKSFLKQPGSGF
jgi:uncharacterized protein (DUF924 family)